MSTGVHALFMFGDPDTCVKVYDPSIEDLDKKHIITYPSYQTAANRLGIHPLRIMRATRSKQQIFSPTLNKKIAIRVAGGNYLKNQPLHYTSNSTNIQSKLVKS